MTLRWALRRPHSILAPSAKSFAGGNTHTVQTTERHRGWDQGVIAGMVANSSFEVRPTAIYANPVLLDLIDRELKSEFNVVLLDHGDHRRLRVKTLSTQAGDLPLVPEWALGYMGTPGSGRRRFPAYIVSEDLIEHHWLHRWESPRIPVGLQGSLASQMVVVKFGGVVVKGASYAHYEVKVNR